MAVYNLEEQEQIDELKAWWKQYGKLVTIALTVFILVLGGTQAWRHYQKSQAEKAAVLYSQLQKAMEANDSKKINEVASALADKYSSTTYASRAGLIAAKSSYEANDVAAAKTRLQWVAEHAKEDDLRDLARLRIAGIQLDEKKYDEALKTLDSKHSEGFNPLFDDLKGDVQLAAGKATEARAAYKSAFDKIDAKNPYRSYVQMKLDALGEAK